MILGKNQRGGDVMIGEGGTSFLLPAANLVRLTIDKPTDEQGDSLAYRFPQKIPTPTRLREINNSMPVATLARCHTLEPLIRNENGRGEMQMLMLPAFEN